MLCVDLYLFLVFCYILENSGDGMNERGFQTTGIVVVVVCCYDEICYCIMRQTVASQAFLDSLVFADSQMTYPSTTRPGVSGRPLLTRYPASRRLPSDNWAGL